MITRREALLGTLLAPLIKPLASMMKTDSEILTLDMINKAVDQAKKHGDPVFRPMNRYQVIDELSTGETRVYYKWIEEDYF